MSPERAGEWENPVPRDSQNRNARVPLFHGGIDELDVMIMTELKEGWRIDGIGKINQQTTVGNVLRKSRGKVLFSYLVYNVFYTTLDDLRYRSSMAVVDHIDDGNFMRVAVDQIEK